MSALVPKDIKQIEKKIAAIQGSTRTLWPGFMKAHNYFRMHFHWYYSWHHFKFSKVIHWLILLVYLIGLPLAFWQPPSGKPSAKATDYDFPRWEWQNPSPSGVGIFDIYAPDANNVWLAGYYGTIVKYNGSSWSAQYSGTTQTLWHISGYDTANIWAVGANGTILYTNNGGASWSSQASGTSEAFLSIYALNATNIWAVGSNGTILKYNGANWSAQTSGISTTLFGVSAYDANNAWAVGSSGVILHTTNGGTSWSSQASGTSEALYDIQILDAQNIWASGGSVILKYNGTTWSTQYNNPGGLIRISILDGVNIWAVGASGTILKYNGANWSSQASGTTDGLYGIAAISSTNVWAAGIGAGSSINLRNYNGMSWSSQVVGTTNSFTAVDALDGSTAWSVGANGTIYYTSNGGSSWSTQVSGTPNVLNDISAYDSSHAWAVGSSNVIREYNGVSWSAYPEVSTDDFEGVEAISPTNVWVVGYDNTGWDGKIVHYDGNNWTTETFPGDHDVGNFNLFYDVAAADSNNVWAVGYGGVYGGIIYKYNGANWSAQTSNSSSWLYGVAALDANNVWAVGSAGTILHTTNGGASWSAQTSGTTNNLYSISIVDANNIWAVGANGTILKYNGSSWSTLSSITSLSLSGLVAVNSATLWAVGASGAILHYYSPANATATKLLIVLPGQSFSDGNGVVGDPSTNLRVGSSIVADIYAVDDNNYWDKGNASYARFSTTDPNDIHPSQIQLTQDGTCVQTNRQPGDPACGLGPASFIFHTPGTWTISAYDIYGVLSSGASSPITVTPGPTHSLHFSSLPASLNAGQASGAINVTFKDEFGNDATLDNPTTIRLTTSHTTKGRFSQSSSGPWSKGSLDISAPAGASSLTFYYLDFETNSTAYLKAEETPSAGWDDAAGNITINVGTVRSSVAVDHSSLTVGESTRILVTLKNDLGVALANKNIEISTSRNDTSPHEDTLTPDISHSTGQDGQATFHISSTVVGSTTITAKDTTDNIYLEDEPTVTFSPGSTTQIVASDIPSPRTAGSPAQVTVTLRDQYNNAATNARGKLAFSSTDKTAKLPATYAMTADDSGTHTFSNLIFKKAGTIKLTIEYLTTHASTTKSFQVLPTVFSLTASSLTSDKTSIINNGQDQVVITATINDAYGNGLKGKTIRLTSNRGDNIIPSIGMTNSSGRAVFTLTSTQVGTSVITAYDVEDAATLPTTLAIKVYKPSLAQTVNQAIRNNPTIKQITENILKPIAQTTAAVAALPLVIQIATTIPQAFQFLGYLLTLLSEALGFKRRPKPWGTVFNALTGKPIDLAIIRLFDAKTKQLVATRISDLAGRFGFTAEPGNYVVSVIKPGYLFPVTRNTLNYLSKGGNYYLGSPISITDKTTNLSLTIPLEPAISTLGFWSRLKLLSRTLNDWATISSVYIFLPLFIIGILLAGLTAYIFPTSGNLILLGLYVFLFAFYLLRRFQKLRHLGTVIVATNKKPLAGATVNILDAEYQTLKAATTTDQLGHFSLFIPPGRYYITVTKPSYHFPPAHNLKLPVNWRSKYYLGGEIKVNKPSYIGYILPLEGE